MPVNKAKSSVLTQEAKVQNALARSMVYQFLSLCFFEPEEKVFSVLKSDKYLGNVQESLDEYFTLNSFNGKASVTKESLKLLADYLKEKSFEDFRAEYWNTLGSFTAAKECPIYETLYGNTDTFQLTQHLQDLADIGGFYGAFNLELSEDFKDRMDHLGIELEFMHVVTYKEAYAQENHGNDKVDICKSAEKKFLKSHLGRWVSAFAKLVQKRAQRGSYPWLAADLLKDFISFETNRLKIKIDEVTEVNVEAMKIEDFECGPLTCKTGSDSKVEL